MKLIQKSEIAYTKAFFYAILLFFLLSVNMALGQLMIIDLVEMKFTPDPGNGTITLEWTVIKPTPGDLYVVERTGGDGVFLPIGMADGVSTFTDKAPLEGNSKYRLRQDMPNNQLAYSNSFEVSFYYSRELSLSPNPTSNVLQIHYKVEKDADIQVQLFDQLGNLLEKHSPNTNAGGHRHINLNVNTYQSGFYFIRLIDGKAIETKQFYKQ